MGLPFSPEARLFYRAAKQRYEDAVLLLEGKRTTGAVYLAGYTVECTLKALLLANLSGVRRRKLLSEFRGNRAHSIEWLRSLYRLHIGAQIPRDIARHLVRAASWSTELRYATGALKQAVAEEFLKSAAAIFSWADARM